MIWIILLINTSFGGMKVYHFDEKLRLIVINFQFLFCLVLISRIIGIFLFHLKTYETEISDNKVKRECVTASLHCTNIDCFIAAARERKNEKEWKKEWDNFITKATAGHRPFSSKHILETKIDKIDVFLSDTFCTGTA